MGDHGSSRRQFLLGGAAGALLLASGCGHARGRARTATTTTPSPPRDELPQYSQLLRPDGLRVPDEVAEAERSPLLMTQARELFEQLGGRRPSADAPLFVTLGDNRGPVTIFTSTGEQCLLLFTSALAAADYKRLLLTDMPSLSVKVSSATQVVRLLRAIEANVPMVTVDRCPRCSDAAVLHAGSLSTPDDVLKLWSVFMATKKARADMYLSFAEKARDAGRLEVARDVALAAVAHVTPDDLRAHELLLDVATRLGDATLRREAETYIAFLRRAGGG